MALTIAATLLLGWQLARRLWPDGLLVSERLLYAGTTGMLLWLATAWLLGFCGLLAHTAVILRTVVIVILALAIRTRSGGQAILPVRSSGQAGLPVLHFIPLVLWTLFLLWRGAVLPVLSHDALIFHFPRAVFFLRAHGYTPLRDLSFFFVPRPANYEMLLADAMAFSGNDHLTEWITAVFYLLFVAGTAAMVRRWWRCSDAATTATTLIAAGAPLLLLQSAAHKNDLMLAAFVVAAFVSGGRFLSTGERASLTLSIASLAAAAGTKTHGAVAVLCFLPFLAWRVVRRPRLIAVAVLTGVIAAVLLGGVHYFERADGRPQTADAVSRRYGDWANLWRGPYILVTEPFLSQPNDMTVPWSNRPIFWRKYEYYFSDLGIPFAIAFVALPIALILLGRRKDAGAIERWSATIAALALFLLILPVHYEPEGLYLTYMPRFVLFLLPIVFGWTLAPAIDALNRPRLAVALALIVFTFYATINAAEDAFAPFDFVVWASKHPGTRQIYFNSYRAAVVADRLAGPHDRILMDARYDAWVYPLFGDRLTRDVRLVIPGASTRVPDDVDWVVVDHAWRTQANGYPRPTPEDIRFVEAVSRDPRFRLVAWKPATMQAVFRRVDTIARP